MQQSHTKEAQLPRGPWRMVICLPLLLAANVLGCHRDDLEEAHAPPTPYLVGLPDSTTVVVQGGTLKRLSPEGDLRWTIHLEGGPVVVPPVAAPDSRLFVRTQRALHSVDPAGDVLWSVPLDPPPTPAQEPWAPVAMADSSVVVAAHQTQIRAFNRDGTGRWSASIPMEQLVARPVVTANGNVLVQVTSRVFCYSPTGVLLWNHALSVAPTKQLTDHDEPGG